MAEKEYISIDVAYDIGTLEDWYISSVSQDDAPVWTDEHLEELLNDFYVIPKDTPTVDVAPVKHGKNETRMNPVDEFICSECGFTSREMSGYDAEEDVYYEFEPNFCPNCGAKMDGGDDNG